VGLFYTEWGFIPTYKGKARRDIRTRGKRNATWTGGHQASAYTESSPLERNNGARKSDGGKKTTKEKRSSASRHRRMILGGVMQASTKDVRT